MSDFDDVLERLLVDPGFKASLAADPDGALARYRLSPDEAELLRAQVTGDTGGQGKVEERTSKASMFGLLSHLGGVGDAIHHAADHASGTGGGGGGGGGADLAGSAGGGHVAGSAGGGGQHVTYETTTTTYSSTTYYSSGSGADQVPGDSGGQGGMLGRNLGSLDLGHGAAPMGPDHATGQGLAGVYESSQSGGAHTVGGALGHQGGGAQAVGGVYGQSGGGQGAAAVGGGYGQQSGQGGLSEQDYTSSSYSSQSYEQSDGGLSAAPDSGQGYGGLSAASDPGQGYGGLSAAPDSGQGYGGLSAASDPGQGYGGLNAVPTGGGGVDALGQGGGSVVGRASVGDYHVNVDVDGDGHWDEHVVVARSDGGVDVLVDANHDGRVDFIGHDYNRDGILDDAVTDDNHDGKFDSLHIDRNGDGWMDRHVSIESHEARTYSSRHAAPDEDQDAGTL